MLFVSRLFLRCVVHGIKSATATAMYPESRMDLEISTSDFQQLHHHNLAAEDKLSLIDVREPWEAQIASIPGSHLIPMGEITMRARQELDPNARLIVYCHLGQRSLMVAMWLRENGFPQAQSLAGGIDAWSRTVDPALARY